LRTIWVPKVLDVWGLVAQNRGGYFQAFVQIFGGGQTTPPTSSEGSLLTTQKSWGQNIRGEISPKGWRGTHSI